MYENPECIDEVRLLNNRAIKKTYLDTPEKCYALLQTLRNERPDMIFSEGKFRYLSQFELQARWYLLFMNVQYNSIVTYKKQDLRLLKREWWLTPKMSALYDACIDKMLALSDYIRTYPKYTKTKRPVSIKEVMSVYHYKQRTLDIINWYKWKGINIVDKDSDVLPFNQTFVCFVPKAEGYLAGTHDIEVAVENWKHETDMGYVHWLAKPKNKRSKQPPTGVTPLKERNFRLKMIQFLNIKDQANLEKLSLDDEKYGHIEISEQNFFGEQARWGLSELPSYREEQFAEHGTRFTGYHE